MQHFFWCKGVKLCGDLNLLRQLWIQTQLQKPLLVFLLIKRFTALRSARSPHKWKHNFACLVSVENIHSVLTSFFSKRYISQFSSWKRKAESKEREQDSFLFHDVPDEYMMLNLKLSLLLFNLPTLQPFANASC